MLKRVSTFQLLPFSFRLLALSLLLTSCSFNPAIQGNGEAYLQGEWKEDSIAAEKQLVTYSLHQFKFECDSFFVTIITTSKVNYGADTCMNRGRWTEYIKGRYQQKADTLHLKGFYCNADKSLKELNTCFHSGVYEEFFSVTKGSDSLLKFSSSSAVVPLNLKLVKRTVCTPKAL